MYCGFLTAGFLVIAMTAGFNDSVSISIKHSFAFELLLNANILGFSNDKAVVDKTPENRFLYKDSVLWRSLCNK